MTLEICLEDFLKQGTDSLGAAVHCVTSGPASTAILGDLDLINSVQLAPSWMETIVHSSKLPSPAQEHRALAVTTS